jgi:Uma2 family endonuclease
MPQVLETNQPQNFPRSQTEIYYPSSRGEEEIIYPEQREDDMGETSIHIDLIADFLKILKLFFKQREDVFLSGNMNLYYDEGNPNRWYAPDLLVAFGVPNHNRSSYQVWKEKVFPQVIFEIASNMTWDNDVGKKYKDYETLGVEEYYILDPEFAYLPAPLMAFHRQGERLLAVPTFDEKVFSPRLNLEIVRAENTFRLFNPQTNGFLRTLEESENELERLKAEIERLKASK